MGVIKFLSDQQLAELNAKLELDGEKRNSLAVQVIRDLGIRPGEVLLLKKSYLRFDANGKSKFHLWIDAEKGSNSRLLPITETLFNRLTKLANEVPGEFFFDFGYTYLQRIWYHYSPSTCRGSTKSTALGLHALRHTAAIKAYRRGKNIKRVQIMLGHKSIDNTLVYMTYVDTPDELEEVMYG